MKEKLKKLFFECVKELSQINIDILNDEKYGKIDIIVSKRNNKRYGCCKQEDPDEIYKKVTKKGFKRIIKYEKFNKHYIEISPWVMQLDDKIIKNTIMHELIHCLPYCNNHGKQFKKYSELINTRLGYDISRTGNRQKDYEKSNIEFAEIEKFKYKIICKGCKQEFYRKRLYKNFIKRYRCGKCSDRFDVYIMY